MCIPSQITCNCYSKVFNAFNVFKVSSLQGIWSMDLLDPFSCQLHHIAFDRLKSHTPLPCPGTQSINIKEIGFSHLLHLRHLLEACLTCIIALWTAFMQIFSRPILKIVWQINVLCPKISSNGNLHRQGRYSEILNSAKVVLFIQTFGPLVSFLYYLMLFLSISDQIFKLSPPHNFPLKKSLVKIILEVKFSFVIRFLKFCSTTYLHEGNSKCVDTRKTCL